MKEISFFYGTIAAFANAMQIEVQYFNWYYVKQFEQEGKDYVQLFADYASESDSITGDDGYLTYE